MVELREMKFYDLDICAGIYQRAYGYDVNISKEKNVIDYFRRYINEPDKYALCIEVNFEIIGFILAFQIPDTVIEYGVFIDNVAIDPCKQRRGYGLEAMKKFADMLPSWTYINLMAVKDSAGYKLYEKAGYKESESSCLMDFSKPEYMERIHNSVRIHNPEIGVLEEKQDHLRKEKERLLNEIKKYKNSLPRQNEPNREENPPANIQKYDEYLPEAGRLIIKKKDASVGVIQVKFKIGFNRAERIMEQLEKLGVVDHAECGRPRLIKVSLEKYEEIIRDIM